MGKSYTEEEHQTILVQENRKAIEHRATWMYLLLKEARERGLEWDDFARAAVKATGAWHGQLKKETMGDPGSMAEFSTVFARGTSRGVFEMDVVKADEESYHLDFHYCPLVSAWKKLGASPEEIEQLCDIAMDGDRGIAEQFPEFEFTLGETIAGGHPVCQIRFDKKK
jgi:hypothetical protein